MDTKEQFLFEFDREIPAGRRLVERIPQGQLDWRPHPSARTLSELAWHMSSLPEVVTGILRNSQQDMTKIHWSQPVNTAEKQLEHFDQSAAIGRGNLSHFTEAELQQTWEMVDGDKVLFAMPRGQFVRWGLITHYVHHRAQLGVYLRALGVSIPSIVGPSLDENPFLAKA